MSEPIIQIRNLTKTFGSGEGAVHALDDINLEIQQGEIFGIIGLSGAGKSTLVRCMNLLERPTSGAIIVDGQSLAWTDEADGRQRFIGKRELRLARRKITMIFRRAGTLPLADEVLAAVSASSVQARDWPYDDGAAGGALQKVHAPHQNEIPRRRPMMQRSLLSICRLMSSHAWTAPSPEPKVLVRFQSE